MLPRNKSNPILNHQPSKTHRKNNSQIKLPKLSNAPSNPQKLSLIYKTQAYKDQINQLKEQLSQLHKIKEVILKQQNMFLVRKIEEAIKYMNGSRILMKMWKEGQNLVGLGYREFRMYEEENYFEVDEEIIREIRKIIKECRVKLGQFKQSSWINVSRAVGENRSKLKQSIHKMGNNIDKVTDKQTRKLIMSDINKIEGQILAAKYVYTEWRQRAVKFLKEGNVHCDILKAQLGSLKDRKF